MPRCPSCRKPLPIGDERLGARCPSCRAPLYERPVAASELPVEEAARCAVHATNAAAGTCQRCGNYHCAVCRTRWRNRWLCPGCVDRALEAKEAAPAETQAQLRQALLALLFGLLAWLVVGAGLLMAAVALAAGQLVLMALTGLLLLASLLPAVLGIGQGAAAVRARGNHLILATIGLVLSGAQVGVMIGLFSFSIWHG